jgi:hypothetical protein
MHDTAKNMNYGHLFAVLTEFIRVAMIVGEFLLLCCLNTCLGKFLWDRYRFANAFHYDRCPMP